jgi:thiazole synthase ThiGH ThiG subunit
VTFNLTIKRLAIEKMKEQLILAGRESYIAGHMPKKPCLASPSTSTTGHIF